MRFVNDCVFFILFSMDKGINYLAKGIELDIITCYIIVTF